MLQITALNVLMNCKSSLLVYHVCYRQCLFQFYCPLANLRKGNFLLELPHWMSVREEFINELKIVFVVEWCRKSNLWSISCSTELTVKNKRKIWMENGHYNIQRKILLKNSQIFSFKALDYCANNYVMYWNILICNIIWNFFHWLIWFCFFFA